MAIVAFPMMTENRAMALGEMQGVTQVNNH
jgi:hypothetical protein